MYLYSYVNMFVGPIPRSGTFSLKIMHIHFLVDNCQTEDLSTAQFLLQQIIGGTLKPLITNYRAEVSKHSPQASSISITQERIRNTVSWVPSLIYYSSLSSPELMSPFESKSRRKLMSVLENNQAEGILSLRPFLFKPSIDWIEVHPPNQGGHFALLSLLIQMLTSSRNTCTDTPRKMFY